MARVKESPIITMRRAGALVHSLGVLFSEAKNASNTREYQRCIVQVRDEIRKLDWTLAMLDADARERMIAADELPWNGLYEHRTYDELDAERTRLEQEAADKRE